MRPNGTQGWVPDGQLAFYTTTSKIVIDLSQRTPDGVPARRRGGSFPVAVGRPGLATPTGFFFVTQKLRPPTPSGRLRRAGAGDERLPAQAARLAGGRRRWRIHGTNEDWLIGKAISHGCVRMHNKDVLQVSRLVPAGSPVVIQK